MQQFIQTFLSLGVVSAGISAICFIIALFTIMLYGVTSSSVPLKPPCESVHVGSEWNMKDHGVNVKVIAVSDERVFYSFIHNDEWKLIPSTSADCRMFTSIYAKYKD